MDNTITPSGYIPGLPEAEAAVEVENNLYDLDWTDAKRPPVRGSITDPRPWSLAILLGLHSCAADDPRVAKQCLAILHGAFGPWFISEGFTEDDYVAADGIRNKAFHYAFIAGPEVGEVFKFVSLVCRHSWNAFIEREREREADEERAADEENERALKRQCV